MGNPHLPLCQSACFAKRAACHASELVRVDSQAGRYRGAALPDAFITDFEVEETNVEAIARDGRTRWKVENENNNVLKTKGYHIEHNFGHGQQHLSSLLLSLNLLAFLMHTILELVDEKYQAIRQALGRRRTFFQHLEALLCYIFFDSWDDVFQFMYYGLELDTG